MIHNKEQLEILGDDVYNGLTFESFQDVPQPVLEQCWRETGFSLNPSELGEKLELWHLQQVNNKVAYD